MKFDNLKAYQTQSLFFSHHNIDPSQTELSAKVKSDPLHREL